MTALTRSLALAACVLVSASCAERRSRDIASPSLATVVDFDTKPLAIGPGVTVSTPTSPASVFVGKVEHGEPRYSGLATLRVTGSGSLRIVEAEPIVGPGLAGASVSIGILSDTLAPGAYVPPPEALAQLHDPVGLSLDAKHEWVMFIKASLASGIPSGYILGARLKLRDADGDHVMKVMAPLQMCVDSPVAGASSVNFADETPRCARVSREFQAAIKTEFSVSW